VASLRIGSVFLGVGEGGFTSRVLMDFVTRRVAEILCGNCVSEGQNCVRSGTAHLGGSF
jgi:hypothetical protein